MKWFTDSWALALLLLLRILPSSAQNAGVSFTGATVTEDAVSALQIGRRSVDVLVRMDPANIQSSSTTAVLTLVFNADMDPAAMPEVIFDPDVQGAISPKANGAKWTNVRTYTIEYSVNTSKKVEIADIDVTVSKARNVAGETMTSVKAPDVFSINFMAPSCTVAVDPERILDGTATLTVTLVYDTDMDMTSTPVITWGNFLDYRQTFTNEQHSWIDLRTCIFTYTIVDKNAQTTHVLLTAGEAKNTAGVEQANCDAPQPLTVDMLDFILRPEADAPTITCNSSQLTVTVAFNQPIEETTDNIISFTNLSAEDFLTFTAMEWTSVGGASVFQAEYAVHPDKAANNPSVEVAVAPVNNFLGREYPGETFTGIFSAMLAPPVIDDATAQSPQCAGVENGEIHLTVSGNAVPFIYTWNKDDEPFTADADAVNLGAGKYDVMIKGTNNCFSTYSTTLINPESVTLNAEVTHHLETVNDGEITLTAEGGTLPYTYYINGTNEGEKTAYSGLDAGIYEFEVADANLCHASISTEVMNYRIPTIFTPNGDTYNDVFMKGNRVEIFDRNGTLVYRGDDGWDGRYKGQLARPAMYFYVVTFAEGYRKKGAVQLYKP